MALELNSTEQSILEHLVSRSSTTAGAAARMTGLKRPTVYAALDRLVELGFVTRRRVRGRAHYQSKRAPEIARILTELAERRFSQATREAAVLEERLRSIELNAPQNIAGYEITSFESQLEVYSQLESSLIRGHYCGIFNPQIVCVGKVKEITARFLRESAKLAPPIREICVAGPLCDWYTGNIRNPNHKVRLVNEAVNIRSDMILIAESVILCHYTPQAELAIRIAQRDYYESMMAIFEELWSKSAKAP